MVLFYPILGNIKYIFKPDCAILVDIWGDLGMIPGMTTINHDLNPSLKHADLLKSVCRPLEAHGITFFGYTAVDAMNQAYCLGSKVDYAENYLKQALANNDIHQFEIEKKSTPQYFFWDFAELDAENAALYRVASEFDQSHTLTITRASEDLIQCYHFSGQNQNQGLNQYYLENLDALHLYIDYFDECLKTIPELTRLFENPVNISKKSNAGQRVTDCTIDFETISECKTPIHFKRANHYLLSDQERECLRWIHRGKPYEMIAEIMNITRKSVERYVASIKRKYHCTTLYQLGEKMAESRISPLLLKPKS